MTSNNTATTDLNRKLSVAPMMDWTNRHCRYFHRLLAPNALVYTEMVTANAILFGDRQRLLGFDSAEHPIALQLGGSDPSALAQAAEIGQQFGYDEINLNVGCPSDRVQMGMIGACLMQHPELVAECVQAMRSAVSVPVTVKHRIGVDDQDEDSDLFRFVDTVANSGCEVFIVHARKAWLKGLSPKENREIPPLNYQRVYRLKQEFPDLSMIINGGIESLSACESHLQQTDGVMLGRAAYQNPYLLAEIEQALFDSPATSRAGYIDRMRPYITSQLESGTPLKAITRHLLGLFQGQMGAKKWRRILSQKGVRQDADLSVLDEALAEVTTQQPTSGQPSEQAPQYQSA